MIQMKHLDKQISKWKDKLVQELKNPVEYCYCLASTINTTKPLCIVVIITFSSLKEKSYL